VSGVLANCAVVQATLSSCGLTLDDEAVRVGVGLRLDLVSTSTPLWILG